MRALDEIEKDYILAVLDRNGGNRTRTAEQLNIGSATLSRKLKTYGVARGARAPESKDSSLALISPDPRRDPLTGRPAAPHPCW